MKSLFHNVDVWRLDFDVNAFKERFEEKNDDGKSNSENEVNEINDSDNVGKDVVDGDDKEQTVEKGIVKAIPRGPYNFFQIIIVIP